MEQKKNFKSYGVEKKNFKPFGVEEKTLNLMEQKKKL